MGLRYGNSMPTHPTKLQLYNNLQQSEGRSGYRGADSRATLTIRPSLRSPAATDPPPSLGAS